MSKPIKPARGLKNDLSFEAQETAKNYSFDEERWPINGKRLIIGDAIKHTKNSSACGKPIEFWKMIGNSFQCPDCYKLKLKSQTKQEYCRCCNNPFTPGCRIRYTCHECFNRNQKDTDLTYGFVR